MWCAISATGPGCSTGGRWRAPGSRAASRWWRTAGLRTTLLAAVPACSMAHARRAIRRCTPVSIRSSGGSSSRDAPGRSGSRHRCRAAAPPGGGPAGAHAGVGWRAFRKTDLVRLLSGLTLAPDELAALIRRSCLTFTPTGRDRADLVALGADSGVLREIDACVRRAAVPRVTDPRPAPAASVAPATPAPPRPPLSGVRSGFVLGVGQHAAAGAHPPLPLPFELRDTAGVPVPGHEVALWVANGTLGAARVVTDSGGRVHIDVTLGPRVGPVEVTAQAGAIERQATLY